MTPALKNEIARHDEILASVQKKTKKLRGASEERLNSVQKRTGIKFDKNLCDLWRHNGGFTLAVMSDQLTPIDFCPLNDALKAWKWFEDIDDSAVGGEWWDSESKRDKRIAKGFLHHKGWFPIAEFNGYSTAVYFDANPSPKGRHGQIIVYQHDPDAVYYVANNIIEFFEKSNDLLAKNLTKLLFLDDEYERICHMKGLEELKRQLAAGLNPKTKNWQKQTLSQFAAKKERTDIVDYLKR